MSHITCPDCGSNEHYVGYGLALGGIGSYTLCLGCDAILEQSQDDDDCALQQKINLRDN